MEKCWRVLEKHEWTIVAQRKRITAKTTQKRHRMGRLRQSNGSDVTLTPDLHVFDTPYNFYSQQVSAKQQNENSCATGSSVQLNCFVFSVLCLLNEGLAASCSLKQHVVVAITDSVRWQHPQWQVKSWHSRRSIEVCVTCDANNKTRIATSVSEPRTI